MFKHLIGIGLAIFSMLCFSVTYAFYKACNPYLSNLHTIFFMSLFAWLLVLPFAVKGGVRSLISPQLGKIVARTLFGLAGLYCITRALKTVGLAEVSVLNNTAPLFVPLVLWFWHRTKISLKLAIGLLVGFAGVWILFRPGFSEINVDLAFAFMSGLATALLLVITRQIAHEPFRRILFYYFLIFWVALLPFVFIEWTSIPPFVWWLIVLAAISMLSAQVSFTMSLRYASAAEVAPLLYTSVIFAGLIDWWVWKNVPTLTSIAGMVIICIGSLMTMNFSKKR